MREHNHTDNEELPTTEKLVEHYEKLYQKSITQNKSNEINEINEFLSRNNK